nr:26S proteasome regulatory subunit 6A homolog [Tanacetum cinerariifolium]
MEVCKQNKEGEAENGKKEDELLKVLKQEALQLLKREKMETIIKVCVPSSYVYVEFPMKNNVFPTGTFDVGDPAVGGVPNRYLGTPLPMLKVVSVEAGMLALRRDATEVNHEDFNERIIQCKLLDSFLLSYDFSCISTTVADAIRLTTTAAVTAVRHITAAVSTVAAGHHRHIFY